MNIGIIHRLWQKAFGQYFYLVATLLVQLGAVLLLPRLLGTNSFAVVAYGQAFAIWVGLFIEFGFSFSAARSIASTSSDTSALRMIVGRVRAANYLLAIVVFIGAWFVGSFLPLIGQHHNILLLCLLLGLSIGLTPWWYFQGREQVWRLVFAELAGAVITVGLWLWLLPENPSPLLTLFIQTIPRFIVMVIGQWLVWKDMNWQAPHWSQAKMALYEGRSLFVFVISVAFYTTLNVLLLGFYASAGEVALFAAAEKLLRFLVRTWEPLNRLFYPQVVRVMQFDGQNGQVFFVRRLFWSYVAMAFLLIFFMDQYSDALLLGLLGERFSNSIELLHILLLAVPMIAMSNVLGMLYLLPTGRDKIFNTIIMSGGFIHLVQSFWLVQQYGIMGMVLSLLITETLVTVAMLVVVYWLSFKTQHQISYKYE